MESSEESEEEKPKKGKKEEAKDEAKHKKLAGPPGAKKSASVVHQKEDIQNISLKKKPPSN